MGRVARASKTTVLLLLRSVYRQHSKDAERDWSRGSDAEVWEWARASFGRSISWQPASRLQLGTWRQGLSGVPGSLSGTEVQASRVIHWAINMKASTAAPHRDSADAVL